MIFNTPLSCACSQHWSQGEQEEPIHGSFSRVADPGEKPEQTCEAIGNKARESMGPERLTWVNIVTREMSLSIRSKRQN